MPDVKIVTKGKWTDALRRYADSGKTLNVGFLEGRTYPDEGEGRSGSAGLSAAQVAFWNEYGTSRTPPRPFMRNTLEKQKSTWIRIFQTVMKNSGGDSEQAFTILGSRAVKDIQKTIEDSVPPPNAESTVYSKTRKKRAAPDHTLVDSGFMQDSLDFEVVDNAQSP